MPKNRFEARWSQVKGSWKLVVGNDCLAAINQTVHNFNVESQTTGIVFKARSLDEAQRMALRVVQHDILRLQNALNRLVALGATAAPTASTPTPGPRSPAVALRTHSRVKGARA
jgi:hypothetical protein